MGKIVRLKQPKKLSRPGQRTSQASATADVLLFTGVRYSRDNDPAPHDQTRGPRRRNG